MTLPVSDLDRDHAERLGLRVASNLTEAGYSSFYSSEDSGLFPQSFAEHTAAVEAPFREDITRFLDILNIREVSDSDREFSPVYISCCRVMLGTELGEILRRLEQAVDYQKPGPVPREGKEPS